MTASPIVRENCKLALAGLRQCNSLSRYTRQTPILAKPPAGIPFLSLCTGEGKNRTAAAGGVVGGGEEVTQRLGREADGNYVCLALCTGRKRWLIPFGEISVFTIFYSFVYF